MGKAPGRASKAYAVSVASTHTSEATDQSRTYWYHQRTKTPYNTRVCLYTGTDGTELTAMKNIVENLLEYSGNFEIIFSTN